MARLALLLFLLAATCAQADDLKSPRQATYRVTGLFRPDRVTDFREVMKEIPEVKLVSLDATLNEATVEFVPARAFAGASRPIQFLQMLDNQVRSISRHTFGLYPQHSHPRPKLTQVTIRVAGCQCKACSLGAYEAIHRLSGVEQATACFTVGQVTALVDPAKIDRARLVAALKQREVDVKDP
ncbi:MAG: hypothetical protein U0840_08680 [Gemmataceae bacterium]